MEMRTLRGMRTVCLAWKGVAQKSDDMSVVEQLSESTTTGKISIAEDDVLPNSLNPTLHPGPALYS